MANFEFKSRIINSSKGEFYGLRCNICDQKFQVKDLVLIVDHKESYVNGTRGVHGECVMDLLYNAGIADVDRQFEKLQKHALRTGKLLGVT